MRRFHLIAVVCVVLCLSACDAGQASDQPVAGAVTTTAVPPTAPPVPSTTPSTTSRPPAVDPAMVPDAEPGAQTVVTTIDGVPRSYRIVLPPTVPAGPVPLVIDLHGFTSNPENHDLLSGWSEVAAREGVVLVQPQGAGGVPRWSMSAGTPSAEADIAFISEIVATVDAMGLLDPDRVYLSGFSNGGGMANEVACEMSDVVAAIGTVAGSYFGADACDPDAPVAVISFHGTADLVVPYDGSRELVPPIPQWAEAWADRNGCGLVPVVEQPAPEAASTTWTLCAGDAEVVLYTIEGYPHSWPGTANPGLFRGTTSIDATELMWDFFDAHPRT